MNNKINLIVSFTTLLTFWGNELGGCSSVVTREKTELSKEEFLTSYKENVDSSKIKILSIDQKTTFNSGNASSTYRYQINRTDFTTYHYLDYKENFIDNTTSTTELKLEKGTYILYKNNEESEKYDVNEAGKLVESYMASFLKANDNLTSYNYVSSLDEEKFSFYKYNDDNTFNIVEKETEISYDIDFKGMLYNVNYGDFTLKEDNNVFDLTNYIVSLTYTFEEIATE